MSRETEDIQKEAAEKHVDPKQTFAYKWWKRVDAIMWFWNVSAAVMVFIQLAIFVFVPGALFTPEYTIPGIGTVMVTAGAISAAVAGGEKVFGAFQTDKSALRSAKD